MRVFDELLLDADWAVNAGMWMWLSSSSFFQQFFHCYCPVRFGRRADPNGDYIRKYLPILKVNAREKFQMTFRSMSKYCDFRRIFQRDTFMSHGMHRKVYKKPLNVLLDVNIHCQWSIMLWQVERILSDCDKFIISFTNIEIQVRICHISKVC